jgi:phosphoglycolate phosphatase-like HAD superfamily hydrolase
MVRRRKTVLVDVDGTLSDASHRLHFLRRRPKDWNGFFSAMDADPPLEVVVRWVQNLAQDHEIVIVTGRPEKYKARTRAWLERHHVPFSRIFMRRDGDRRPDYVAKAEVLRQVAPTDIAFAIDDRGPVCAMWKENGIKCYRVAADTPAESAAVNEAYRSPRAQRPSKSKL